MEERFNLNSPFPVNVFFSTLVNVQSYVQPDEPLPSYFTRMAMICISGTKLEVSRLEK